MADSFDQLGAVGCAIPRQPRQLRTDFLERKPPSSVRTDSGHRRYPRAVIRKVAFIVFAQKIRFPLEEIGAELARLPRNRAPDRADWSKLSANFTKRIEERIAELERMKSGLSECIGCGCLSLESCQFANPGDRAGRRGPGPRYWIQSQNR